LVHACGAVGACLAYVQVALGEFGVRPAGTRFA
jgi:hypothetical protein